jgi:DNA-binding LacI/PurR family transcriptional regulator
MLVNDDSDRSERLGSGASGARLEDVARLAGVSSATVSRVLNGSQAISTNTRKRVLKAIQELRYRPNIHARNLAVGKSNTLGLVVSNIGNPFFLDIFQGLEYQASLRGYELMISSTSYDSKRLASSIHYMLSRRVAGLALFVSEMDPELVEEVAFARVPVVMFDGPPAHANTTNIRINYGSGMQMLVDYIRQLGHERIGFVGHHSSLGPLRERQDAFVSSVKGHLPNAAYMVANGDDSPSGGQDAARQILDSGLKPTAILCANDYTAIGVLRECHDRKIDVPGEVSVAGFDNTSFALFTYPPLSTVSVPTDRIANHAITVLLANSSETPMTQDIVLLPELVIRRSTAPARSRA